MVRCWADYEILKTKYVQALNKNYIIIHRKAKGEHQSSGLYYIDVDFHELEPEGKLSNYIHEYGSANLNTIIEYKSPTVLTMWDALGTPLSLAVSYVLKDDPADSKVLLKVLTVSGECEILVKKMF